MGARGLPHLNRKGYPPPSAPIPAFPQRGKEKNQQAFDLEHPRPWR
jgi:hypothetical protein